MALYYPWLPTVDGVEAVTHPWIALDNGDGAHIPVLLGTNSDEGAALSPLSTNATLLELHQFWSGFGFSEKEIRRHDALYLDQTYPEEQA